MENQRNETKNLIVACLTVVAILLYAMFAAKGCYGHKIRLEEKTLEFKIDSLKVIERMEINGNEKEIPNAKKN